MSQVSIGSAGPPEAAGQVERPLAGTPLDPDRPAGPIERFMSSLIRKLAWSRLANPRVAVSLTGTGLLLGMLLGATAPNAETVPVKLPLSYFLPSLADQHILASVMLYTSDILACLGLAGMLWAHSQGWQPNPRKLLLISAGIVAIMVSLAPVGSSDVGSYVAYGRITAEGGNPYVTNPLAWFGANAPYSNVVGDMWRSTPSVYGPFATWIQAFAAWVGGTHVATTVWMWMILNGAVFVAVGWVLLKTSDDPVRATLFWSVNPVLLQVLVSGGHLDTFVAAGAICAIQVARRLPNVRGDLLAGAMIGLAAGVKIYAVLIGLGLAWPLLLRGEWLRTARIAVVAMATLALGYSYYGLGALVPLFSGLKLVTLPSPWRVFELAGQAMGVKTAVLTTIISVSWPIALLVVAWLVHKRISPDQPLEVVAPFALTYAWILVMPWVFAWYTAVAWAALTQVPRNRMTRWLTLVTVFLALCLSSGGQAVPGR